MKINRLKADVLREKAFTHRQQARQAFFTHYNYDLAVRVAFEKQKEEIMKKFPKYLPLNVKTIASLFLFDGVPCTAHYCNITNRFSKIITPAKEIEL